MISPLEMLYLCALKIDKYLTQKEKLPRPVLSVGNIALGGRAKTPLVIEIATILKQRGWHPVVLTRGYRRKVSEPRWLLPASLANGEAMFFSADEVGDEPLEIFIKSGVPVLVGADRKKNAHAFLKQYSDRLNKIIFILDDGFQHWKLHRDFDLVIVENSDYKAKLLPVGPLRESTEALKRADLVLELGKSVVKIMKVPTDLPLGSSAQNPTIALAVTTRAGKQREYFLNLEKKIEETQLVKMLSLDLRDHASNDEIITKIHEIKGWNFLVLGWKEFVKILDIRKFAEDPTFINTLKKTPFLKDITLMGANGSQGESVDIALVDLEVKWDAEHFYNALIHKIGDV